MVAVVVVVGGWWLFGKLRGSMIWEAVDEGIILVINVDSSNENDCK